MRYDANITFRISFGLITLLRTILGGTLNRYYPQENEFSVEAEIEIDKGQMTTLLGQFDDVQRQDLANTGIVETLEKLTIKRIFRKTGNTKSYAVFNYESGLIETFVQQLLLLLPRILYFDTFLDNQFPNTVEVPTTYISDQQTSMSEHATIVARMFELAGSNLHDFLQNTDPYSRKTILSEVNKYVTEQIINDWVAMHLSPGEIDADISSSTITILLRQNETTPTNIDIDIVENFEDKNGKPHDATMPLSDRSLGFRWFFNFSVRKCFGTNGEDKFIYLFDEPGSYLQESAQTVLLKAIRDFARDQYVIFSTHSDDLLNPEIININNIKISEKRDREIKLKSFAETKTKRHEGALSPVYKALRSKINLNSTLKRNVAVTEGITDFYFWTMRLINENIILLPGFGAGKNEYLISIAIGTAKKYVAIFDGDPSGDKEIERYAKFFGEAEKNNWYQYKNKDGAKVYLEALFSAVDEKKLLDLTGASDIKKALTLLFYSTDKVKNSFWGNTDSETNANIQINIQNIKLLLGVK